MTAIFNSISQSPQVVNSNTPRKLAQRSSQTLTSPIPCTKSQDILPHNQRNDNTTFSHIKVHQTWLLKPNSKKICSQSPQVVNSNTPRKLAQRSSQTLLQFLVPKAKISSHTTRGMTIQHFPILRSTRHDCWSQTQRKYVLYSQYNYGRKHVHIYYHK